MYHKPHRTRAAVVAARSTKHDPKTAIPTGRPTGTRTGAGLYVTVDKDEQVLIPQEKLSEFYQRYPSCSDPTERVQLCRELAA